MKKGMAILVSAIMILVMAVSVYAAPAGSEVQVTFSTGETATAIIGEPFEFFFQCNPPGDMGAISAGEEGAGIAVSSGNVAYSHVSLGGPFSYPTSELVTITDFESDFTVTVAAEATQMDATYTIFFTVEEIEAAIQAADEMAAQMAANPMEGGSEGGEDQGGSPEGEAPAGESPAEQAQGGSPEGEAPAGESPEGESPEEAAEPDEETMEAVDDMAAPPERESQDAESSGEPGGESAGGSGDASGMPDTTMGGKATSRPPDNSTKAIDILGTRAAIYIEYAEDGYTVSNNISDAYTVEGADIGVPVIGTENVISGLHIECDRIDWDAENAVGNSGIIINALQDTETTFVIGGEEPLYDAPNGEKYNTVIIMKVDENEEYDTSATETAPGCSIAINGNSLLLKNVYVESSGKGRPSIHVPASTRDKNVKQLSDLICVDSYIVNHSTRALLLMGGDVWFLNSKGITDAWGALSYDNTSTTMYVVNSLAENNGTAYAIYDAAGCTAYIYGSKIVSGGTGITVCRTATLTTASLSEADETATAPYNGTADLLTPAATEDGRTIVVGYYYPIKMHADMSGADSVASAYLKDTYLSSQLEDVVLYDGTDFVPPETVSGRAGSEAMNTLVNEYTTGMIVQIACHNGKVVFDNCELNSRKGELVHSFFTYDSMASGIYPIDGVEYIGDEIVFRNMSAEGDVIHEDYMRKMTVSLENAELTGTVTGNTLTGWNNYWREQMESIDSEEGDEILVIHDETYETVWGVRMSMDASSVWNVAGTSQLYSFTAEEGAVIKPAEGKTMTIYVDCTMDNGLEAYDTAAGTRIDTFEPGVEYTGVVIIVE